MSEFGRRPTQTSTLSNTCSAGLDAGSAVEHDANAVRHFCHARDFRVEQHPLRQLADPLRQNVDQIAVGAGQQTRRHLDDGDLAAERGVHAAKLEADVAAADDEQGLRQVGQIERSRGVPDPRAVERQARHARRPRAGRQDGVLELGPARRRRRSR